MKNLIVLATAITILLPCLWSCEKNEPIIFDQAIIGKWKLVAEEQEGNRIIPVEADGYIEYLANGEVRSFIASENRFSETSMTYQIDSVNLYWYMDDIVTPYFIYEYTFNNRNELKLKEFYSVNKRMLYPYPFIYERIKE